MTLCALRAARAEPDAPALVQEGRVWSWGALAPLVRQACGFLKTQNLPDERTGARVAWVPRRTPLDVAFAYALIASGYPMLPLHPRYTERERRQWVRRVGAALVLNDVEQAFGGPEHEPASGSIDPETPLAVIMTSGTTGAPRGAVLSRRAFEASAAASAQNLGWQPEDRWLVAMPLAHVGGLSILTRVVAARKCAVLYPEGTFDADGFVREVERSRVTIGSVVPTMLGRLLAHRPAWDPPPYLRALLVGGSPIPPTLLSLAETRGWPLVPTYGLTEACSQVATQSPFERDLQRGGCGRVLPSIRARIHQGEIQVQGPTLLSGYLPSEDGPPPKPTEWFATGDLGVMDSDGRLHVTGRISTRIISGGENVSPEEVEQELLRVTGVDDVCAFGERHAEWGEVVAVAFVGSATVSAMQDAASVNLAPHKRPHRFFRLDHLDRNPQGKLDRKAIQARAQTLGCATSNDARLGRNPNLV